MGMPRFISRIIIKGRIKVPEDKIHFYVKGRDNNDYTDIPFKFLTMEEVCNDLKNYENITQVDLENNTISEETKELIGLVRSLELKNFLIESFIDYGDSYPIDELINIIIQNENIIRESLISPVDPITHYHFSDIHGYEYDDIIYYSYESAKLKYQKKQENEQE